MLPLLPSLGKKIQELKEATPYLGSAVNETVDKFRSAIIPDVIQRPLDRYLNKIQSTRLGSAIQENLPTQKKSVTLSAYRGGTPTPSLATPVGQSLVKKQLAEMAGGLIGSMKIVTPLENASREVIDPIISKIMTGLRSAKSLRSRAEVLYTAERAKRAAQGSEALLSVGGERGYFTALGKLKGELPKPDFTPIMESSGLVQKDVDELINYLKNYPRFDFWDSMHAIGGLRKLFEPAGGKIPTESELKLLKNALGDDLISTILSKRTTWEKFKENASEVLNVPRALMSSMDMSAPLRQGLVLSIHKPKIAAQTFVDQFRYFFSPRAYRTAMDSIAQNPLYRTMKDSGLALTDITGESVYLTSKEEVFMSNLAAKIPGVGQLVKASERAYAGFLNKLRADVFNDVAQEYIKGGQSPVSDPELFKGLARFINSASGRGDLGKLNPAAPILNTTFFSPRFIKSRLDMLNPVWYAQLPVPVRKEAAKAAVKFVSTGIGILTLAKLSGAEVEMNPLSSDFGKIKLGNTRYDVWGGFQGYVRLVAQLVMGKTKSLTSGEIIPLDKTKYPFTSRLDQTIRFGMGKFAPIPALVADIMRGQNMMGEPVTPQNILFEKLVPLYIQDITDVVKQGNWMLGVASGIPAFFGVGTQTFTPKKKKSTGSSGLPQLPKLPKLSL